MKIFFNNDGSYGEGALYRPVLINDKPIGFISEVTDDYVACHLFDMFVAKQQNTINVTKKVQDIMAIGIQI